MSTGDEPGRLADRIATAVAGCPSVARLAEGPIATYLPGRRVTGVRTSDDRVEVAVVAVHGVPVRGLDAEVRAALAPLADGRPVDVHVADVLLPGDLEPGEPAPPAAPSTPL